MKIQLKLITCFACMIITVASLNAQNSLFTELKATEYLLSEKGEKHLRSYSERPGVANISLVSINTEMLRDTRVFIEINGQSSFATRIKENKRSNDNFAWLGKLEDDAGIYFTVAEQQVISKFRLKNTTYSLMPLEKDIHMLIEVDHADLYKSQDFCGLNDKANPNYKDIEDKKHDHSRDNDEHNNRSHTDNNCVYRILIVYTQAAADALAPDLSLFAQGLVDEVNLAYTLSEINLEAELARTLVVNHTESNAFVDWPPSQNDGLEDLITFRNDGDGILDEVHDFRERYRSDVQFLIRDNEWTGASGVAYWFDTNAEDAFAVSHDNALTLSAFIFSHEIGHLQGGYHQNHDFASPIYAKGHQMVAGAGSIKTIMGSRTAQDGIAQVCPNGCRIHRFSNFGLLYDGIATGTATNDNARRFFETANRTRNYRVTSEDLIILDETIEDEGVSNHLANNTITTDKNTLVYKSGSLGTMRAGENILLQKGTHVNSGARFLAFINNDPCEEQAPSLFAAPPISEVEFSSQRTKQTGSTSEAIHLSVTPNPASDKITIRYILPAFQSAYISIVDARGQTVKSMEPSMSEDGGEYTWNVNIQNLPPGLYFCQLQTKHQKITQKFIVE